MKLISIYKDLGKEELCYLHNCTTCGAFKVREFLYKDLFKKLNICHNEFHNNYSDLYTTKAENREVILNCLFQSLNDLTEEEVILILEKEKDNYWGFKDNIVVYVIMEIYFMLMTIRGEDKTRENVLEEMCERISNSQVKYLIEKMNQYYFKHGYDKYPKNKYGY